MREELIEAAKKFRRSNAHAYQFTNKNSVTAECKMMADFAADIQKQTLVSLREKLFNFVSGLDDPIESEEFREGVYRARNVMLDYIDHILPESGK